MNDPLSVKYRKFQILDSAIVAITWRSILSLIITWGEKRESRYICICNVHSVVTAKRQPELQKVINNADLATPDGMPLVWMMRRSGSPSQQRINGPDLMWKYCEVAEKNNQSLYLFGSTESTLELLALKLRDAYPQLRIAGTYAPPFRPITEDEDRETIDRINNSGAGVVFVGLGCPKQELWMASHRGKVKAVMIGVGAAFDYHAGTVKRAPKWMQHSGLEWFYRLASEPKRLWKRYLTTNSLFVYYLLASMFNRWNIKKV